jgi:hypothetical protein
LAHGGEKHEPPEGTPVIEEQPAVAPFKEEMGQPMPTDTDQPVDYRDTESPVDYGTTPEQPAPEDAPQPSLGLENDPLGLGPEPLDQDLGTAMPHTGHEMAGMKMEKHVEPATHELVSSSRKGYGLAVGITVLSGLAAGLLFLKRPTDS